ncbi:hypothetical protein [Lachnoclostridium sp. An76]|uniref:hypothetical protein n=1 Tax=Lachnoclostridium sp. An76 TaxID=1965654 RepID=UPI000B3894CA|nr:hypothetical protein [Lachnoclostridium sp. An76]
MKLLEWIKEMMRVKKVKIKKYSDGIGHIDFWAEITIDNTVRLCNELMKTSHLHIIADDIYKSSIYDKWLNAEEQERIKKYQGMVDSIYFYVEHGKLAKILDDLMKADAKGIAIIESEEDETFFRKFIDKRISTNSCLKDGKFKSVFYLDIENHPFDITFAFNLNYHIPGLEGKYYILPSKFE